MPKTEISQEANTIDQTRVVRVVVIAVALVVAFIIGRSTAPDGGSAANGEVTTTTLSEAETALSNGLALHGQGKLTEAEVEYMKVLDIEPNNQYALYNIGVIAQTNKTFDKAIEYYTKAIATDAKFTSALYNRGLAYRDSGNVPNALADLEAVIKLEPTNAAAYFNAGSLYVEQGEDAKGNEYIDKAKTLNPELGTK